jgi:hypothetical protein
MEAAMMAGMISQAGRSMNFKQPFFLMETPLRACQGVGPKHLGVFMEGVGGILTEPGFAQVTYSH